LPPPLWRCFPIMYRAYSTRASDQGPNAGKYNVYRVPPGYPCARHGWDLIIVALSAEPVTGSGLFSPLTMRTS
ncbi:hypothetical protein O5626_28425, partial [Escherichia coli]|nr:hypothetical protein [Escherichia coli]